METLMLSDVNTNKRRDRLNSQTRGRGGRESMGNRLRNKLSVAHNNSTYTPSLRTNS